MPARRQRLLSRVQGSASLEGRKKKNKRSIASSFPPSPETSSAFFYSTQDSIPESPAEVEHHERKTKDSTVDAFEGSLLSTQDYIPESPEETEGDGGLVLSAAFLALKHRERKTKDGTEDEFEGPLLSHNESHIPVNKVESKLGINFITTADDSKKDIGTKKTNVEYESMKFDQVSKQAKIMPKQEKSNAKKYILKAIGLDRNKNSRPITENRPEPVKTLTETINLEEKSEDNYGCTGSSKEEVLREIPGRSNSTTETLSIQDVHALQSPLKAIQEINNPATEQEKSNNESSSDPSSTERTSVLLVKPEGLGTLGLRTMPIIFEDPTAAIEDIPDETPQREDGVISVVLRPKFSEFTPRNTSGLHPSNHRRRSSSKRISSSLTSLSQRSRSRSRSSRLSTASTISAASSISAFSSMSSLASMSDLSSVSSFGSLSSFSSLSVNSLSSLLSTRTVVSPTDLRPIQRSNSLDAFFPY